MKLDVIMQCVIVFVITGNGRAEELEEEEARWRQKV